MTREEILKAVHEGRMTHTQAMTAIRAPAQVAAPAQSTPPPPEVPAPGPEPECYNHVEPDRHQPRFKVASESGWCSVYLDGLRRPVSLPAELWEEILDNADRLRQFLKDNQGQFRSKKRRLSTQEQATGTCQS
jgi:hypothetical protein